MLSMSKSRLQRHAYRKAARRSATDHALDEQRATPATAKQAECPTERILKSTKNCRCEPCTPWERILRTTKEHDKHTIDAWKDDISNLLIVTGLFSSVVSAFTVQSNTLLQSPPVDPVAPLLAQISSHLLALQGGSATMNATGPPVPIAGVDSAFTPTLVAVNVNILWVTSLTLSLLVALFALAVQQWLRHTHLSPELSARTALRLRQLRYESLRMWQVPGIISLLPVVLQIAVVLFLVGLLLLLVSLNNVVAVAFKLVAGFGLALFLAASLIPFLVVRCAYKSPLIPTALIVLQWTTYPAALIIALPYTLAGCVCEAIPLRLFMKHPSAHFRYLHHVYWPGQQLLAYIRSFGTHMRVDPRSFWTNRELRAIAGDTGLDCRAYFSALITMPDCDFSYMKERMCEYAPSTRMRSALLVVIRTLGFHRVQDVLQYYPRLGGNSRLRDRAKYCIPSRHAELLLDTLPTEWISGDPMEERDVARILYLVFHATSGGARELQDRVDKLLRQIRTAQSLQPFDLASARHAVPTLLLFDQCVTSASASEKDAKEAVIWADLCHNLARGYTASPFTSTIPDIVLASTAIALSSLTKFPDVISIERTILHLTNFVEDWSETIRHLPYGVVDMDSATAPKAIQAICQSLLQLSRRPDCLSLQSDAATRLHELVRCLRKIYFGPRGNYYANALPDLEAFMQTLVTRGRRENPSSGLITLIAVELDELHASVVRRVIADGGTWQGIPSTSRTTVPEPDPDRHFERYGALLRAHLVANRL